MVSVALGTWAPYPAPITSTGARHALTGNFQARLTAISCDPSHNGPMIEELILLLLAVPVLLFALWVLVTTSK